MKFKNDIDISSNMKINEFLSDMDKGSYSTEQIVNITKTGLALQSLRDSVKREIRVTSGIRNVVYNKAIGGDSNSYHIKGKAVDFELVKRVNNVVIEDYTGFNISNLLPLISKAGFGNASFYMRDGEFMWIHCDIGTPWKNWKRYSTKLSYRILEV